MNTANFLSIPATMFADQEILVFGKHRRSYGELLSRVRREIWLDCDVLRDGNGVASLEVVSPRDAQAPRREAYRERA